MRRPGRIGIALGWALAAVSCWAVERFPPPDFTETGHQLPVTTVPPPRAVIWDAVDVALLVVFLAVAAWLVHRKRSRRWLVWLSIAGLAYFGFYREGCICAIGSIQNVVLALGHRGYAIPLAALGFFVLPLLAALFFGRVFCAGVCPHGALQDLLLIRPVRVPRWLESGLRLLPWIYLGAAVLLAALDSAFIICRYDPFVGIFRLNANATMLAVGGLFVLASLFVGRPYCRYVCPYGAVLGVLSTFARREVKIAPERCTNCRLCEDTCPFGAINLPQEANVEPRRVSRRRAGWLVAAVPLIVAASVWGGWRIGDALAGYQPRVALAEQVWREASGLPTEPTDASKAFYDQGGKPAALMDEAAAERARFRRGGLIYGAFVGLVVALALLKLAWPASRAEYEADRSRCLACGRCFEYCPYELQRRGVPLPEGIPELPRGES